jgi:hypothetical protein
MANATSVANAKRLRNSQRDRLDERPAIRKQRRRQPSLRDRKETSDDASAARSSFSPDLKERASH